MTLKRFGILLCVCLMIAVLSIVLSIDTAHGQYQQPMLQPQPVQVIYVPTTRVVAPLRPWLWGTWRYRPVALPPQWAVPTVAPPYRVVQ